MIDSSVDVIEIYPKILVYRNMFKDINKIYEILKESSEDSDDRVFSKWSQWSRFGEYLDPTAPGISASMTFEEIDRLEEDTIIKKNQKTFLKELLECFYKVSFDYTSRFSNELNFDLDEIVGNKNNQLPRWQMYGPSIAKYHKDPTKIFNDIEMHNMAMTYHSDFIREPIVSPGYKFALTTLAYFNDDYEDGQIDFCIGKELYAFKPKAGDFLMFPSGHPDVLAKDGNVYLHGVVAPKNTHKYLARMYWRRYSEGDQEWFDKQKEFGTEKWLSMQGSIMEKYRQEHPQRYEIPEGVRIK